MTDVGEIRTDAHFAEKNDRLKNVVTRSAAAVTPMALNIGASIFGAHLLRMTIDATIRRVDARAAHHHARKGHGIGVATVFIRLGIKTANLKIWHHRHAEPREGENAEDTEEKRLQTLSSVSSPGFSFERIQKCRDARGPAKAKQHQTKVEGKNAVRDSQ